MGSTAARWCAVGGLSARKGMAPARPSALGRPGTRSQSFLKRSKAESGAAGGAAGAARVVKELEACREAAPAGAAAGSGPRAAALVCSGRWAPAEAAGCCSRARRAPRCDRRARAGQLRRAEGAEGGAGACVAMGPRGAHLQQPQQPASGGLHVSTAGRRCVCDRLRQLRGDGAGAPPRLGAALVLLSFCSAAALFIPSYSQRSSAATEEVLLLRAGGSEGDGARRRWRCKRVGRRGGNAATVAVLPPVCGGANAKPARAGTPSRFDRAPRRAAARRLTCAFTSARSAAAGGLSWDARTKHAAATGEGGAPG
jgi:hypothetical protein